MLTEVKDDRRHYFEDDQGRRQGEYKSWHVNGNMWMYSFYVDGKLHGERKAWNGDGTLVSHTFWVNGKVYRSNLIVDPVDDKDKFVITLETGGKWLC